MRLIQRLTARVPGASAGQIGTLYNSLAKEKVSDFGSHVQTIYNQKLWEKKEGTPMSLGYRAGDLARRALDYIVD